MSGRQAQSSPVRFALAIIIAHAVVAALHAIAHLTLDIRLSQAQLFYIVVVITLAPLVAGVLLWKKSNTYGALLLSISMAGASVFGVYNHFVALSPDHVSHVAALPQRSWSLVFRLTALLLAIVETIGVWAGLRALVIRQDYQDYRD